MKLYNNRGKAKYEACGGYQNTQPIHKGNKVVPFTKKANAKGTVKGNFNG